LDALGDDRLAGLRVKDEPQAQIASEHTTTIAASALRRVLIETSTDMILPLRPPARVGSSAEGHALGSTG
jgi:hypothetical protein